MVMRVVTLLLRPTTLLRRGFSTFSGNDGGIIEIDLSSPSSSSSSSSSSSEEVSALKRLDDVVQRLMVQKATPDWLPFRPGASFWVPPRSRRNNLADLLTGLADNLPDHRRQEPVAFRFSADGKLVEDSLSSDDEDDDGIGEIGMDITDDDEVDDKDGDKENSGDMPENGKGG